jgi:hypothetical protein
MKACHLKSEIISEKVLLFTTHTHTHHSHTHTRHTYLEIRIDRVLEPIVQVPGISITRVLDSS